MYMFFENGMRGGVSYVPNRYSKAKNKYFKSYDPKQESNIYTYTQIIYMVMQCLSFFQQVNSNGQILSSLT